MWSPDNANFKEHGPLKGKDQGSDRAEVRRKHSDLWHRINENIGKLISIRWVKAHLNKRKATAAGVSYEDWYGNNQADEQARAGAEKHGYTRGHTFAIKQN
eukprot:2530117-Heterocapsa_arctica.AAC.1